MSTTGGRRVGKRDMLELARALGDEDAHEGESMLCIFLRALDRARELGAPASTYPRRSGAHPIVRDWARLVVGDAVGFVQSLRMGDNEAERFMHSWIESALRQHAAIDPATCSHTMKLGRCIRCGQTLPAEVLPPLSMIEDRSVAQLAADGDL